MWVKNFIKSSTVSTARGQCASDQERDYVFRLLDPKNTGQVSYLARDSHDNGHKKSLLVSKESVSDRWVDFFPHIFLDVVNFKSLHESIFLLNFGFPTLQENAARILQGHLIGKQPTITGFFSSSLFSWAPGVLCCHADIFLVDILPRCLDFLHQNRSELSPSEPKGNCTGLWVPAGGLPGLCGAAGGAPRVREGGVPGPHPQTSPAGKHPIGNAGVQLMAHRFFRLHDYDITVLIQFFYCLFFSPGPLAVFLWDMHFRCTSYAGLGDISSSRVSNPKHDLFCCQPVHFPPEGGGLVQIWTSSPPASTAGMRGSAFELPHAAAGGILGP